MNIPPFTMAVTAVTVAGVYVTYPFIKTVVMPLFSPLRSLPGPQNPGFLLGSLERIMSADDAAIVHEEYVKLYGPTLVYQEAFNTNRLFTMDLKAISHVLSHVDIYYKPDVARKGLSRILGEGLAIVEGEAHKRQRRVLNPAFGPPQLRNLSGIFVSKANELRDIWAAQLEPAKQDPVIIDVLSWLNKATLDIIGLAGFNYRFASLTSKPEPPNELNAAFTTVFRVGTMLDAWALLIAIIPILRLIPTTRQKAFSRSMSIMNRIGRQLVAEKKAAVLASTSNVEKKLFQSRDILSLLVRANMATDLPDSQRLADEEVLAQIPTFLVAGQETTAAAVSWALHALSLSTECQTRLRTELQTLPIPIVDEEDSLDPETLAALNELPLLDAVIRETMRLWAPVPYISREAIVSDTIPLSRPIKDRHGTLQDSVRIAKGDGVIISLLALNRSEAIWGEDAHQFNPDRWLQGEPSVSTELPGVWSHLMTFIGGPRACIGYRFSILEAKILIHTLVSTFVFRPAKPDIARSMFIVDRPHVKSQMDKGPQLPLMVERFVDNTTDELLVS